MTRIRGVYRRPACDASVRWERGPNGAYLTKGTVGLATFGCALVYLECGGKRSATPLWLARRKVPAQSKRRRRCALPAHAKGPACRLSSGLLCNTARCAKSLGGGFKLCPAERAGSTVAPPEN